MYSVGFYTKANFAEEDKTLAFNDPFKKRKG
jgi:hypothetical protein